MKTLAHFSNILAIKNDDVIYPDYPTNKAFILIAIFYQCRIRMCFRIGE